MLVDVVVDVALVVTVVVLDDGDVVVVVDVATAVELTGDRVGADSGAPALQPPTTTASVAAALMRRRPPTVGIRVRRPRSGGRGHDRVR